MSTCSGCRHDADLDTVLKFGYSDFCDHDDTCPVLIRHLARLEKPRPKPEKVFFWPEPDPYEMAIQASDLFCK